jgi:hypothetical protein
MVQPQSTELTASWQLQLHSQAASLHAITLQSGRLVRVLLQCTSGLCE